MALVFLTSGTSWTVPSDCTRINWVDTIGSGADGVFAGFSARGGGGGAYARKNAISVTPGTSVAYQVGAGLDTVFGGTVLTSCICGAAKANGATGGLASSSAGDVTFSGGNGDTTFGGAGGAAGPNGAGIAGSGYLGGAGDAGSGGAGGAKGIAGGAGTEYDASHGAGGGAGGRNTAGPGFPGGLYGGGGGGHVTGADGAGQQGLIVINYTPTVIATMGVTEGADTLAATASMVARASLAVTEGADTFAGTAKMTNVATMAVTEAPDIVSMSDAAIRFATMNAVEAPDTFAATGTLGWTVNMAATEDPDVFAGVATVETLLDMAVTEGADGFSGAAVLANSAATAGTSIAPFRSADYLDLITSEHRGKPKFTATVSASVSPAAEQQAVLDGLSEAFDLDTAIGVQLDAVGAWVGISREIQIPLVNVWFSFGIEGRGWGQGIWKGPYDPETGVYSLDDDTYRKLIRLKILVNNWDGLTGSAAQAIETFYAADGSFPFLIDNQNMSMTVCISGDRPAAVMFAIFAGRYVEFKPASVKVFNVVPSVPGTPVFGFGVDNERIGGWGSGSWARNAEDAMIEELSA
ncbi:DUF2612 domain-containing protein [Xanthobacter flavus]|uniref:DUF2612 domain-containing protein n=1 Tax=Xanthobacter flavus TaxID=281 RepID=UPI0037288B7E